MKIRLFALLCAVLLIAVTAGCASDQPPKIGVAFGVGPATRWPQEIKYMEEYSKTLGVILEARLNTDEKQKPLAEDCKELIDSGIDVLIVRPRDVTNMKSVVDYAHQNQVKVISYDSLIEGEAVDLLVGYDSEHTGRILGGHLSEIVTSGNYILIWGDNNRNVEDMYRGAMGCLDPLKGQINILLETGVPGWSPEEAKRIVKETVTANGNQIDAILAFNDKLAGACAEAVAELGIQKEVVIAGMDAELDAVKRIVAGTQACTAYMDLKALSHTTIDHAINLAKNQKMNTNSQVDNNSGAPIPSYLLTRQLVTKQNIHRVLIDSGYYTFEQVYGG